jgi:hypothetical protein
MSYVQFKIGTENTSSFSLAKGCLLIFLASVSHLGRCAISHNELMVCSKLYILYSFSGVKKKRVIKIIVKYHFKNLRLA